MLDNLISDYYAYARWANGRVLDQAEQLTEDKLLSSDLDNIWSIRDTLVHIMAAQSLWLDRWKGITGKSLWDPRQYPDVDSIREKWAELDTSTKEFIEQQDDDSLAADFTYTDLKEVTYTRPLWQQLLHQANHATYHRGEVAALLSRYGLSPGELDFLRYLEAQD